MTNPFLTDSVAKARKRKEFIRIAALSLAACLFVSLTSNNSPTAFLRAVAFYGIPFSLLIYFVRQVLPKIRMPNIGLAILFRSVVYTAVFLLAILLMMLTVISDKREFVRVVSQRRDIILEFFSFPMFKC